MDESVIPQQNNWRERAIAYLLNARNSDGGWGYQTQSSSNTEPTCYATLALLSNESTGENNTWLQPVEEAAKWLSKHQNSDGSVTAVQGEQSSAWLTSLSIMIWLETKLFSKERILALKWLLSEEGATYESPKQPEKRIIGHDQSLVGWPWVSTTHSWLEPTVFAILAVSKNGQAEHPRVREGFLVVQDRQEDKGTWNFGNTTVLGNSYPAQPTSTGLGLIARSMEISVPDQRVEQAIQYLKQTLPEVRSAGSLCWGLQGLASWDVHIEDSSQWLLEAFDKSLMRSNPVLQVALMLLGGGAKTLSVIGQDSTEVS